MHFSDFSRFFFIDKLLHFYACQDLFILKLYCDKWDLLVKCYHIIIEVKTEQTWFLVADVDVERQDDDVGDQRRPPVDHKHHHAAQHGSG